METIEVFYKPIGGSNNNFWHKYIVYTDSNENKFYGRGGHENNSLIDFGNIDTDQGAYEPGTEDWDVDGSHPSEKSTLFRRRF